MPPRSSSAPASSTDSTPRHESASRSFASSAAFPRASAPDSLDPELIDPSLVTPPPEASAPSPAPGKAARRIYREGDVIGGKYRLRYVLGEGGMGMVWLAHNDVLNIDVAIKFIRREVNSTEATVRLHQEARAAARIDHPSIVRVIDFGESEHRDPYIVMEVLRGEQLVEAIERRKRFSPTAALRILLPIASAVAAAHDRRIVHRDLKPENIFLVKNDRGDITPKIVDFGIAKVWSETASGEMTKAGTVLGSPDYMSPEQARGITDVDGQTDVWAFAVVLYETITGQKPFQGGNYHDLVAAILVKDPTPITALGVGDEALWAIIARGLGKERFNRWRTMREMGVALARWAIENGVVEDVTGTSLAVHWLSDGEQRPLSERPAVRAQQRRISERPAARAQRSSEDHREVAVHPVHQGAARPTGDRRRAAVVAAAGLATLVILGAALFSLRAMTARDGGAEPAPAAPPAASQVQPQAAAARSSEQQSPARESLPEPARTAEPQPSAGAARLGPAESPTASAPARGPAPAPRSAGARRTAPSRAGAKTTGAALPVPARPNF
ncbi:serine/threonine-protein kinase [Sorangium sp. So ce426]|uniref:serine/threonine-protein kinase n=1 Tax=unclassified Sorangium TaxID=2621164 RepID=UPI003F5C38AD